jgi:hypothetical protein
MLLLFVGDCFGQEFCRPLPVSPENVSGATSAGSGGSGEAYLLKIEEVESPVPRVEQIPIPGVPQMESGWVQAGQSNSTSIRIAKSIELMVSINSPFHLKITDRGDVVELSGRLIRSAIIPAKAPRFDATGQQPPQAVGEQGQDFLVEVEYKHVSEGQTRGMTSSIPIRVGKKWLMAGGLRLAGDRRAFPPMLWSIEPVKADSGK